MTSGLDIVIGASALTALGVFLLVAYPRGQRLLMLCAWLLALAATLFGDRLAAADHPCGLCAVLGIVALGLITFAGWNLFARRGTRWQYRVVIYGIYGAALQFVTLIIDHAQSGEGRATVRISVSVSCIYAAASVAILLLKPSLGERMVRAVGRSSERP